MAFKFYIDGQLTDQPINDTEVSSSIKRDRQLNNLLFTQDVEVEYNGNNAPGPFEISGYEYLKNAFDNSVCEEVEIKIYDDDFNPSLLYYTGIIKIPNVKIDLQKVILKTKIQDNSFYSYINNNKNLKVDFAATTTKNGLPLTPLQKWSVDMFNQSNCTYGSTLSPAAFYHMYDAREVFSFIISAISDNKISFQSDFLDSLNPKPFICKGQNLLNSYTLYPNAQEPFIELTFEEMVSEFRKFYNVFFWIDNSDQNNPVLKLENTFTSYFNEDVYSFNGIKDMNVEIDSNSLYSKVEIGTNNITTGLFDSGISYFGFKIEEYYPNGQCNIDNTLELINEFVVDTNSIQDILINNTTDLIDNIFVIQCAFLDPILFTAQAFQWQLNNDGNCWYNIGLNNTNKLSRHTDKFTTTFGNFVGNGSINNINNGFKASLGQIFSYSPISLPGVIQVPISSTSINSQLIFQSFPFIFSDETSGTNYDSGNNYFNTLGEYHIPLDGNYNFIFNADCTSFNNNQLKYFRTKYYIERYDASNNLIDFVVDPFLVAMINGNYIITVSFNVNALAGEIIKCRIDATYNLQDPGGSIGTPYLNYTTNTYFQCVGSPDTSNNGGNGIAGNNYSKKYTYEFDYEIPASDYIFILNNINKRILFEKDGITRYGWIESIKRNDWTGISQIKLITSNAATSQ